MAEEAIGTYLQLLYRNGQPTGYAFQNFAQGRTINYRDTDYIAAGFGFSGAAFDASASSISASILFGLNQLDLNVFMQASEGRWLAEVRTTWLNSADFSPESDWTVDIYEVLGLGHDNERLSIQLGSPLDAVSENLPRLRLTQAMVGALPATGSIPFS